MAKLVEQFYEYLKNDHPETALFAAMSVDDDCINIKFESLDNIDDYLDAIAEKYDYAIFIGKYEEDNIVCFGFPDGKPVSDGIIDELSDGSDDTVDNSGNTVATIVKRNGIIWNAWKDYVVSTNDYRVIDTHDANWKRDAQKIEGDVIKLMHLEQNI